MLGAVAQQPAAELTAAARSANIINCSTIKRAAPTPLPIPIGANLLGVVLNRAERVKRTNGS